MTQLPATMVEVEALIFAREWIAQAREPNGIFHPNAEEIYETLSMKQWAQSHPFHADDIVYFANNGSREADLALRELIAEYTDRGEPLTAILGAYNIRLINRGRRRPGPAKAANFMRDLGITMLVYSLVERFKLSAYRNTESRRPSASSVAAKALTEAGIGVLLTFKGVEKVLRRYLPVLAASGSRYARVPTRGLFD